MTGLLAPAPVAEESVVPSQLDTVPADDGTDQTPAETVESEGQNGQPAGTDAPAPAPTTDPQPGPASDNGANRGPSNNNGNGNGNGPGSGKKP